MLMKIKLFLLMIFVILLIIIFFCQSCVVRTSYPDQAALLIIPGIPQVAQQKGRRLPVCRHCNPESLRTLFISIAQKPVPDKVLIICLLVPEHKVRHWISAVDVSSDKCFRRPAALRSRKLFERQAALPGVNQIFPEAFCIHLLLVHTIYPRS